MMARVRRVRLNDTPMAEALTEMNRMAGEAGVEAGLDMRTVELIRLRASQLNGCGSCLKAHTALALEHGESAERIGMLTAWRDSDYFTQVEESALALTELITLIGDTGYEDEDYEEFAQVLSLEQISAISWIAIAINSSNRVWIANNPPVRLPKELRRE